VPVSAVCISYASGADGEGIGHEVARALGFRYVDEEILLTAAQQEGLEPEQLEAIEQRRSGLARLQVDVLTGGGLDEILRSLIRRSVAETAAAGEVVIVAHAASIALAADESVLRVLVTAPPEVRAKRLADAEDLDEREAGRRIEGSDKGRAAYFQQFYGIDRELPHHYDLVVNTERLSPERAVALVLEAAAPLDS
jgi:cytidylate kinase